MAKAWKKEHVSYLKRYAKTRTLADLASRFGTDEKQVLTKLEELGLSTKDGKGYDRPYVDPAIEIFEKGLQAFFKQQWSEAEKIFGQVVAQSDQLDLTARARLHLELAVKRRAPAGNESVDPYLEAVVAKNAGAYDTAQSLCSRGGRRTKDERYAYLAASLCALEGNFDEALDLLRVAIELNPKNRVHAYHDPDFEALRGVSEFDELFESAG